MSEATGFTLDKLEAWSREHGEPEWMLSFRRQAFDAWRAAPLPDPADEDWRRTDLSFLDFDALSNLVTANGAADSGAADASDAAGCISFVDGEVGQVRLDAEIAAQGVILSSLHEALRDRPELVRDYFMTRCVTPEDNLFARLHAAFWTNGMLLYVPAGVQIERPILSSVKVTGSGVASLHHTLVIAESDAKVDVVEEYLGGEGETLSVPVVEVFGGDGAKVTFSGIQNWGRRVHEFASRRAHVGRDGDIQLISTSLGGKLVKSFVGAVMDGEGGNCDLYGVYFPEAGQKFDTTTMQDHRVGNCTSDLLFKGALYAKAKSVFRGVVRVHKDAQNTDAYQTNNNLLLGDGARADSMPVLEIEADDVRCSHGATLAHLTDEDLFYLRSRGLTREVAQRMVIAGFFEPILERIPLQSIRDRLHDAFARRIAEH